MAKLFWIFRHHTTSVRRPSAGFHWYGKVSPAPRPVTTADVRRLGRERDDGDAHGEWWAPLSATRGGLARGTGATAVTPGAVAVPRLTGHDGSRRSARAWRPCEFRRSGGARRGRRVTWGWRGVTLGFARRHPTWPTPRVTRTRTRTSPRRPPPRATSRAQRWRRRWSRPETPSPPISTKR